MLCCECNRSSLFWFRRNWKALLFVRLLNIEMFSVLRQISCDVLNYLDNHTTCAMVRNDTSYPRTNDSFELIHFNEWLKQLICPT